jgi:hypothetical protein
MSEMEDRVSAALKRNPYLGRKNLRFETQEGRVVLRGVVESYFQKQMAQEALKQIEGVKEIANELEVRPLSRLSRRTATFHGVFPGLVRHKPVVQAASLKDPAVVRGKAAYPHQTSPGRDPSLQHDQLADQMAVEHPHFV